MRVVDLTTAVLGPVATQHLGDLGADVIKVETPQGDFMRQLGPQRHPGMAAYFLHINRNKRGVVLDLKQPAQRAVLLDLIGTADVLVHNMRLGAAERLGLDYAALAERHPRLVHASATGFNRNGPQRDRPAYDDIIQGESALAALNAGPDGAPRYLPMAMCDKLVGQALASAIGMALFARERSGRGQEVHVPMLETMLAFNLVDHLWHGVLDEPEKGLGYPRMFTPHRRPYATADGYVCLMATTDNSGGACCRHWGAPSCWTMHGFPPWRSGPRISTRCTARSPRRCAGVHGGMAGAFGRGRRAAWRAAHAGGYHCRSVPVGHRLFPAGAAPERGADDPDHARHAFLRHAYRGGVCRHRGWASTRGRC